MTAAARRLIWAYAVGTALAVAVASVAVAAWL